ncbi:MAG: putative membrane protein [Alteromonas naphthalenivorans]|jgi:uncharacterized membrane protein
MKTSLFRKAYNLIKSFFVNGLLALLPILITASFFSFTFKLIKSWLAPLQQLNIPYINLIPHGEIILVILFIFSAGIILRSFIIQSIIDLFEMLLSNVPLIAPVYTGVKQLVQAFSPSDTDTFKEVVLVEFPLKGTYSIGFLTSELTPELSPNKKEPFYNIFIPTTPNPTTGYFAIMPKKNFTVVDLTTQEAMSLIISGGIIQPDKFK